jgi:hypothetical protein
MHDLESVEFISLFGDQPKVLHALAIAAVSPPVLDFPIIAEDKRSTSVGIDVPSAEDDFTFLLVNKRPAPRPVSTRRPQ